MSKSKKEDRIIYLDLLRIFLTVTVVILHIAAQNWHDATVPSIEWTSFNLWDSLVRRL